MLKNKLAHQEGSSSRELDRVIFCFFFAFSVFSRFLVILVSPSVFLWEVLLLGDGSRGVLWHYWFHCVFQMVPDECCMRMQNPCASFCAGCGLLFAHARGPPVLFAKICVKVDHFPKIIGG